MNAQRINEIYLDYSKALKKLDEALKKKAKKGSLEVDGTIQRFEFTFELAWKLLRAVLEYNGIQSKSPRMVIKDAYKAGFIKNGETWIDMMEDRNKTSHIYDETQAMEIYKKIKNKHHKSLIEMRGEVKKLIT